MERINIFGRYVCEITSEQGQKKYYDHLNYCRDCKRSMTPRIVPAKEDVEEYLRLKQLNFPCTIDSKKRDGSCKFFEYKNRYDWRPAKSGKEHFVGLVSPTGETLLPNVFADVFTQFDAIANITDFVPVSNGDGWALVSLGQSAVLMTEFRYNAIIPERWEKYLFFVQDKETKKWGALRSSCQCTNNSHPFKHCLMTLETIMPCIADSIYEDELMVDNPDELPSLFFMTRSGDKVGILTDFGYSKIIYDFYEVDNMNCSFRLVRNNLKRGRRADWWHPDSQFL